MKRKSVLAGLVAGLASCAAYAQNAGDFYKGKNVDLYIGYSAGGGYDLYGRLVARYLGRHLPNNPTVTPKNMDGAGSLRLANFIYNGAPKDGLSLGIVARGTAFDPLFGSPQAQFDASKYNWIGSANNEVSTCVMWAASGATTMDDILNKQTIMGGSGGAADTDQFVYVINGVLGAKIKLVLGYPGGNEVNLAMERGEVQGRCGWSWSSLKTTHPEWLKDKKVTVPVQLSLTKHAELPDVPLVTDYAKTEEQREIFRLVFARNVMGRPFIAAPGIPAERVAIMRKAFMDTMNDKDFLAEADKINLEINAVSGEDLQKLVADAYKTPPDIVKKTGDMLKGPN
jgi:tripartite-type tricarboxylate transporter receptor subunit TctC